MPELIEPICPDCEHAGEPVALTVLVVQTVEPVALRRDDRGNVYADEPAADPADWENTEVLDTDRDGVRLLCSQCGYEGDAEDWAADEADDLPPCWGEWSRIAELENAILKALDEGFHGRVNLDALRTVVTPYQFRREQRAEDVLDDLPASESPCDHGEHLDVEDERGYCLFCGNCTDPYGIA